MAIMTGSGRLTFTELDSGNDLYVPVEPMSFSLENTSNKVESVKYLDGVLVTAGTAINSSTWALTIGIQAVNWNAIQFALGELASTTPTVALPELKYATVPLVAPFEIADALIVDQNVRVGVINDNVGGPLTSVAGAPANASEVQVDDANNKLVFDPSLAGVSVAYRVFDTKTNLSTIGVEDVYQAISQFSFEGILNTDGRDIKIVIPKLERASFPTINVDDVTQLDITFDLLNETNSRFPFELYQIA